MTNKYQYQIFEYYRVKSIPYESPCRNKDTCSKSIFVSTITSFINPTIALTITRSQGQRQYRTNFDSFAKLFPIEGMTTKPKINCITELTIQSKLFMTRLVKRKRLKQQIMMSGQVRIQTPKLQFAIDIGIPSMMKPLVMSMGVLETLIMTTMMAQKKGKQTTLFKYMRPIVKAYAANTQNKQC